MQTYIWTRKKKIKANHKTLPPSLLLLPDFVTVHESTDVVLEVLVFVVILVVESFGVSDVVGEDVDLGGEVEDFGDFLFLQKLADVTTLTRLNVNGARTSISRLSWSSFNV